MVFNDRLTVDRSGTIYIPKVGSVHVSGIPFSGLDKHLRSEIGRVFRNFDLNVNMGQLRSIQVFVLGQARRPGSYTVSSLSTLINALFASGGPSVQGSMRSIQLKRDGKTVSDLDLYTLISKGDKSQDLRLLPGDVIFIPPAGPQSGHDGKRAYTGHLRTERARQRWTTSSSWRADFPRPHPIPARPWSASRSTGSALPPR